MERRDLRPVRQNPLTFVFQTVSRPRKNNVFGTCRIVRICVAAGKEAAQRVVPIKLQRVYMPACLPPHGARNDPSPATAEVCLISYLRAKPVESGC